MSVTTALAAETKLAYLLEHRPEISQETEENVLNILHDIAGAEGISGFRPLAISIEWRDDYMSFDVSRHEFLRQHELPRNGMFCLFIGPEGELRDGDGALAELRQEIETVIDDEIAALRERLGQAAYSAHFK